jgi:hypothetical protein
MVTIQVKQTPNGLILEVEQPKPQFIKEIEMPVQRMIGASSKRKPQLCLA